MRMISIRKTISICRKDPHIEDLSWRVEQLESSAEESRSTGRDGIGLLYALGMAIAVTLSWAGNASILWCILHGLLSWGYVVYFALTR